MKISKSKIKNIIFFIMIGVLLFPKTRQPIQVLLHKTLAVFSPSINDASNQIKIDDYNWRLKDENGTVFNFEQLKDKVVLVNFWATWCPPCIAEMPSMQSLYNDYKGKIEFVFVSNEDNLKIDKFKSENDYTFKVYSPITKYPEGFNVSSIPRTFLIDKTGNIVIDKTGAANWNSKTVRTTIDKLLSTKF
ncbi:TlpA disulfide reductase family protein [uncultured Algibacter sp.]|uniref:TlpA family protein disulfide reductase n=1 Tax=uncultured Algibacter sp. TaxID=298659 RepID=UPI00263645CD|nr:TlpA disulfide reductase family protein [uncultured Algibacter sp.]